jgi:[CysO sulfur-carrier protein]-S-L-cysteine hydrolase
MKIAADLLAELIAHAEADAPNECCGVVAIDPGTSVGAGDASGGPDGDASARARKVHRAENIAASPLKFEVDGQELLGLIGAIEDDGGELGAIYHSHTRTAPKPSQTDINFAANWPGVEWIIVGLADGAAPEVRSYLIEDGRVREVALEVE